MRLLVVAIIVTSFSALAQESVFPSKEERKMARLLEPQQVTAEVKAFLKLKMKAHNKDMRDLVLAVATLKYDEAKRFAQGIANSPRLADEATPAPAFKTLQDALKKDATAVVEACEKKDPDALAASFDSMMATCMSCHNAYLVPLRDEKAAKKPAK